MPTYQYLCAECGHEFEVVQAFTDDAISACQKCQGPVRKVYNSVGIVFKGSGFYKTDSRNPNTGTNTGTTNSASASNSSTTSTTSSGSTTGAASTSSSGD